MLTALEADSIFAHAAGEPFAVEHLSEPVPRAQFEAAVDPLQKRFAALMLDYALGDAIAMLIASSCHSQHSTRTRKASSGA